MAAYADTPPDRYAAGYSTAPVARQVEQYVPLGRPQEAATAAPAPVRRRTRDVSGAVLMFIAAGVGLFSWFGPWSRVVDSVTGQTVFLSLRGFREQARWALAIQGVLVAGIVIGVVGLALLIRSRLRRYLGLLALLAAMTAIVAEIYYLIQAGFGFENTWLGYWAFLAAGFLMLVAAVKALGTSD